MKEESHKLKYDFLKKTKTSEKIRKVQKSSTD